jgi:hypothetical protein
VAESQETSIGSQRLAKHIPAATDARTTIEELLVTVSNNTDSSTSIPHGSREICIVRRPYQATINEDITDREDLVCAVVICRVCRLASHVTSLRN